MAKASKILRGVAQFTKETATLLDGTRVEIGLRPLGSGIDGDVLERAHLAALERKVVDPKDGQPIYDYWLGIYTLFHAAVDIESDPKKPELFFDGGIEQIRTMLDREQIAFLLQMQRVVQAECAPRPNTMGPGEFMTHVTREALAEEGDDFPFGRWHPWLQRSFLRTLANLYWNLLKHRSLPSSDSSTAPMNEPPASPTLAQVEEATRMDPVEQVTALRGIAQEKDEEPRLGAREADEEPPS